MGGSSKQVTGYRYFANFLLFIGNPIEKVLGINFDKRGWETGKRVPMGTNGELCYLHLPNLYGENEGGVSGVLNIKHGSKMQTVDSAYTKYMNSISLPASAYPYQSYISFSGSELASQFQGMTDEELQDLADEYEDGIVPGKGFYLGNSGYMKEMLLWPKRTRVRNDGREQWYATTVERPWVCEIGGYYVQSDSEFEPQSFSLNVTRTYTGGQDINEVIFNKVTMGFSPDKSGGGSGISNQSYFDGYHEEKQTFTNTSPFDILIRVKSSARGGSASAKKNYEVWLEPGETFLETAYCRNSIYNQESNSYVMGVSLDVYFLKIREHRGFVENDAPDINPIHKIREILTDDTAMSKPESDVNDINFMKAADCIWDDGLGISWSITEKSCLEAIEELCGHIEAGVRVNRQTGLYEMVLFRDDWFDENEIHTLAVTKIKSMSLEVANADEAINQLNVSYYNREAIKDSSFSIAENAAIRNLNGRVNAEDADFPYFMNQRNAAVVAQWKLKQMSSPVWKGSFTTAEYNARKWNRYDLLKLAWPRKWQGTITVRIMKINLGTGADVSIDFVEVVPYSSNLSSDIVIDEPIDTAPKPPQPALFKAFELSYFEAVQLNGQKAVDDALAYNPDVGYAAVIAKRPQSNSLNALMYTDVGNGFERAGSIQYCETAELDQNISKSNTAFIVKNASSIGAVGVGTQITIDNEIMVYQSYDEETSVLTVKRGALDTIPQMHSAGSILYFADDFVAVDSTEYAEGEAIDVKALTTTPSGVLDLDDVNAQTVTIQSRAIRPYPPANVKINEVYWPAYIENDLNIVWSNRNRTQQTGGEILGYFDSNVTLELNTQTLLTVIELDENNLELATHSANVTASNSFTLLESAMQVGTRSLQTSLKTVRDGYECLYAFDHIAIRSTLIAPSNVTFEVIEY